MMSASYLASMSYEDVVSIVELYLNLISSYVQEGLCIGTYALCVAN